MKLVTLCCSNKKDYKAQLQLATDLENYDHIAMIYRDDKIHVIEQGPNDNKPMLSEIYQDESDIGM